MAITTTFGKKAAAAALVALTLGAGMTMNANDAEARGGRKGAAIAAGIIGALAVGAIAASASNAHAGYGYYGHSGYDYDYQPAYAPAPVYYHQPVRHVQYQEPVYEYVGPGRYYPQRHYGYRHPRHPGYTETGFAYRGPVCKVRKQTVFDGYGYRVQKVQVCR